MGEERRRQVHPQDLPPTETPAPREDPALVAHSQQTDPFFESPFPGAETS